jgi:hypothetical protein
MDASKDARIAWRLSMRLELSFRSEHDGVHGTAHQDADEVHEQLTGLI